MQPQLQPESLVAAESELTQAPEPHTEPWSLSKRIGFRFAFGYLVLYSFPGPLAYIPGVPWLLSWYGTIRGKLVTWTGAHVLHLSKPVQYFPTGSGDTTYAYVQNMLFLVAAVVAAIVWSVMDRRRRDYRYLHQWLRLYVRLTLGATLLGYGSIKVIQAQFPHPYLTRLLQPYGESSPMGLLWTFMGYSHSYNVFTGSVEMLGGALLIIPQVAMLGALISAASMTNVFLLNMSYDVPVKIYSLNLLLMSCFLLLPEMGRLTSFFILNRNTDRATALPLFRRRWLSLGILGFQVIFLVYCGGIDLHQAHQESKQFGDLSPTPKFYGIYTVEEFKVDGQVRPPLLTDSTYWHRLIIGRYNSIAIQSPEGVLQRYRGTLNDKTNDLELTKYTDKNWKADFSLEPQTSDVILMSGQMDGRKISAKLHKLDLGSFLLNSRGFHWINEFPYNR